MDKELSAEIRNKLQTAMTVLELLKNGKDVPKKEIEIAIRDLEKIVEVIN